MTIRAFNNDPLLTLAILSVIFKSININYEKYFKIIFYRKFYLLLSIGIWSNSDELTKEIEEIPQIFKDYSWLKEMVNHEDCKGASITVLTSAENSAHNLVVVDKDGKKVMYNASGEYYCSDHATVNCREFYKLDKEVDSWSCK